MMMRAAASLTSFNTKPSQASPEPCIHLAGTLLRKVEWLKPLAVAAMPVPSHATAGVSENGQSARKDE